MLSALTLNFVYVSGYVPSDRSVDARPPSGHHWTVRFGIPHRKSALATLALLVATALSPPVTVADHAGRPIGSFSNCRRLVTPPRCSSVGNDARHHVLFDATLTPEIAESLRDTMIEDYEPTKLTMVLEESLSPQTDVIAFSQDYGNLGAAGWVYCPAEAPQGINRQGHRWCQQQELHFNLNPTMAAFFADDASRDHVACHELGHSLGLRHWGNPPQSVGPPAATCMNANTPDGPTNLHQVDWDHIERYRYTIHPPSRSQRPVDRVSDPTETRTSAWEEIAAVELLELESYESLIDMSAAADAVVRGRITSVTAGRSFGAAGARPLHYAAATISLDEVVAGTLPARHLGTLMLEIPLFGGPDTLEALANSLPREESLFFLRGKGPADGDAYRLVNVRGVIVSNGGVADVVPGAEFLEPVAGQPFVRIVAQVRDAR